MMRIALALASASLISTGAFAQVASPQYGTAAVPATAQPYAAGRAGHARRNGAGGQMTPEQKAQRRAQKQAKLAAMSPAQRQAHEQKRAARRAARQQGGPA